MKQVLTILLLLLALGGSAQTLHYDSSAQMSYVNIVPVKAKFNDTVLCARLYVRSISDNLQNSCTLYFEMRDSAGAIHMRGNGTISGEDYASWGGDNQFPFIYEADILGLTTHD